LSWYLPSETDPQTKPVRIARVLRSEGRGRGGVLVYAMPGRRMWCIFGAAWGGQRGNQVQAGEIPCAGVCSRANPGSRDSCAGAGGIG
jgi:hypothetical protein